MADHVQGSQTPTQEFPAPQICLQAYKALVQDVAERLGEYEVNSIVFQQDLPEKARQLSGLDVLISLERNGLFSPGNIEPLADLLRKIRRHDLVTRFVDVYWRQRYGGALDLSPGINAQIGMYDNDKNDVGGKNDWHYVTLTDRGDEVLEWRNRAGVSWTLTLSDDPTQLAVGTDCPYYRSGHTICTVVFAADGTTVAALLGPGNQRYDSDGYRQERINALVGAYENHKYDAGGKNDWHYVTLTDRGDQVLEWRNRAGVSWTLTLSEDPTQLAVGQDCPYYDDGHTICTVVFAADGTTVAALLGPWNEQYDSDGYRQERINALVGVYENHKYDAREKNDWHYVTLTDRGDEVLEWRNRAGVSWKLTLSEDPTQLAVGQDCPYYDDGHTICTVVFAADGTTVAALLGPGNERYASDGYRQERINALVGAYENHEYDAGGKNDWHYVTLTDRGDEVLEWRNRAGVSWTLTLSEDPTKLAVGTDCPYYPSGHTICTVVFAADGTTVAALLGPWNERYDSDGYRQERINTLVGAYENHKYDAGGKNDWHYVTLTDRGDEVLEWGNTAGVSPNPNPNPYTC